MRVWNKQINNLTGKDLFKLYLLFSLWKGINQGLNRIYDERRKTN